MKYLKILPFIFLRLKNLHTCLIKRQYGMLKKLFGLKES